MTRNKGYTLFATALMAGCLTAAASGQDHVRARGEAMLRELGQASAHFEANRGQLDPRVDFAFRAADYRLQLFGRGIDLVLPGNQVLLGQQMQITFLDTPGAAGVQGEDELPFSVMRRLERDGVRRHLSRVPTFGRVHYRGMYSGIDVQYHLNQGQLEYDFVVAPHADPSQIALGLEGAREAGLDAEGNLRMLFPVAELVQHKPRVYQLIEGRRVDIDGHYEMQPEGRRVDIVLGAYDANHPLIIDPLITVKLNDLGYELLTN